MSLPSGYKRLEYIQSTGTQYVNAGFKPNNNTRVVLDFELTAAYSSIVGIFGARDTNSGTAANQFVFWNNGVSTFRTDYFRTQRTITVSTLLARYQVDKNKNVTTIGSVSATNAVNTGQCINNLYLFCTNAAGTANYFSKIKLYSCQIYNNGILVRDFIPCQKPDGTVGLWDDVNSVFYGNAGKGTFTAGPVAIAIAADKSEITKLAYIQSSGTQYIDTGFKPNQNTTIAAEFEVLDASNDGAYLYGGGTGTARLEAYPWDGKLEFNYGSAMPFVGTVYANKRFYICQDKTKYTLSYFDGSGEWTGNHAEQSFTSAYTLAIFALNRGTVAYPTAGMKLYSCKIYDNGTLIRDYIPAKLDDGTVGLYDKLSGLLYINAGTGTFISGGNVLNLPVNIGGTWKKANEAFVNIGGTWKTVKDAFVNIGGAWKKIG